MKNKKIDEKQPKRLLVTMALPYANGDIHLGHLVEAVQTDVYVRFKKMVGQETIYVCADDTHGTPIELNAMKRGITPEQLIDEAWKNHSRDYASFSIDFDIFYSTNSPENRKWSELVFQRMQEKNLVEKKVIEQYYCESCGRFLPDRFISGTCPKCGANDQYGDVCESCGATYDPVDLKNPKCVTCGEVPVLKSSEHFFVQLATAEPFLRKYLNETNVLQDDMKNFVMHWIDDGLKEWCISRDGPYFGFEIPGTTNKYFYVWLDAPIGYIASTEKWCNDNNRQTLDFWGEDAPSEIVHFIGKDIVYFHILFWPVMLQAASLKLPSREFVHGFLTVEGEKMSKSRGTFILAKDFVDSVKHPFACEYLRFYYGAKLTNNTADIDLNVEEFCNKVNTILVNNIGNLHHRTSIFLERFFESKVPDVAWDRAMAEQVEKIAGEIKGHFENVEFKAVIEKVQALGSMGNKYYQDTKPWELVKSDKEKAAIVMVTCVNLVKACAVFLKPFIPNLTTKFEKQYNTTFAWSDYTFSVKGCPLGKTEKIVMPLEQKELAILSGKKNTPESSEKEETVISIEDFHKVKLQIGAVKAAERVEKADKLLKLVVDDGKRERQIVAGIAKSYTPEEIVGKKVVFVANLKPAKIRGLTSEGMILAAIKRKKMCVITPDNDMPAGAQVS